MEIVRRPVPDHPLLEPIRKLRGILNIEKGCWVAGGAAMRILGGMPWEKGSDLDIFCRNAQQSDSAIRAVKTAWSDDLFGGGVCVSSDVNTRLLVRESKLIESGSKDHQRVIQVVKNVFFEDVASMLADFDFTVARVVTDGHTIVYDARAKDDLDQMLLRPAVERRTRMTAERVVKYLRYGFHPTPGLLSWALALDREGTEVTSHLTVKGKWDGY